MDGRTAERAIRAVSCDALRLNGHPVVAQRLDVIQRSRSAREGSGLERQGPFASSNAPAHSRPDPCDLPLRGNPPLRGSLWMTTQGLGCRIIVAPRVAETARVVSETLRRAHVSSPRPC